MLTSLRALALLSGMTVWMAAEAKAAEYQCQKDDSSVRIAVEVKKLGHTLPCEVIAEDDRGERAVLYKAQFDRDYCPERIERTRRELEDEGWRCQQTSEINVVKKTGASNGQVEQAASPSADSSESRIRPTGDGRYVIASRQCTNGASRRLIHIEVNNPNRRKPCELIYWGDGNESQPGELLWRAEHDADFCPRRLETIVGKWIDDGWQCDADGIETAAVDVRQPESTEEARSEATQAANAGNVPSIEDIEAAEQVPVPLSDEAADRSPTDDAADDVAADDAADDAALEAVISADAERIGQWMEVEPAIEIAARGDLNDDGADDAVVFLAYQSDQAIYRQYLMSYLVAGDGYELAGVKLLTGVKAPPEHARIDQIDDGIIWLTRPANDGSAPEPTGYRLRDQQLIEIDPNSVEGDN